MNGRNTFQLYFYVRETRTDSNGKAPIYLRITSAGEQSTISINRKVSLKLWNSLRGAVTLKAVEAAEINPHIESLRMKAFQAQRQLLEDGQPVTPDAIISLILGRKEREYTLLKIAERHNSQMNVGLGVTSSYGNFKNYKTSLLYLREFVEKQFHRKDILLSELNIAFVNSYVLFLQKDKSCHHNGAMKQVQRLKKMINQAISYGWINKDPFQNYKIRFNPYDKVILTAEELNEVEILSELSPKLSLIRDAFIFSCYTGFAYVDLKNLTYENVVIGIDGNRWIITRRQKSHIKARIPLLPKALEIMEKYGNHPKLKPGQVIPMYSNQKTNDYLKEIAKKAGITKPLSFHCARHIFATVITMSNGVPIETVSKMLGHTNIRTTQVYSRVLDEKIAKDFEKLKLTLKG